MAKVEIKVAEKILKSLSNKRRLLAVQYLLQKREANLGDISRHLKLSYKATSKHLTLLAAADILEKEQRSVQMFFRISKSVPTLSSEVMKFL